MITRWRYFRCSVMITRWWHCLSAAMIPRWHYNINAVMITRWRHYLNAVMLTGWQYCLSSAMITRWHYCICVEMVTGWIHWIVNVSNCKELWIARRKHHHLQTPGWYHSLGKKTGWGTRAIRWTERERKRGRGCNALWKRRIKAW